MDAENLHEIWHVEANDQVFETNFEEMTGWIADGSLLRMDRVRKGDLRWIEAGKVPSLLAVFNAMDDGQPIAAPVVTLTKLGSTVVPGSSSNPSNMVSAPAGNLALECTVEPMCSMHADVPAVFVCETCSNQFCPACPNSHGGTGKICPFCGAMCKPLTSVGTKPGADHAPAGKFGFSNLLTRLRNFRSNSK